MKKSLKRGTISESVSDQGYVVCSNPRSGSTYLIYLLRSTGALGVPYEWIRGDGGKASHDQDDYTTNIDQQIAHVLRDGRTDNGVYALKMFPEHFDRRIEGSWIEHMPNLKFLYLTRSDLLGQAISLSVARQTVSYGIWTVEQKEPVYNRQNILDCLDFIVTGEARWRFFFAINGIDAPTFTYEDLVLNPQATVDKIAEMVNVTGAKINWSDFLPKVQRKDRNENWRRQFLREVGDRTRLPILRGITEA